MGPSCPKALDMKMAFLGQTAETQVPAPPLPQLMQSPGVASALPLLCSISVSLYVAHSVTKKKKKKSERPLCLQFPSLKTFMTRREDKRGSSEKNFFSQASLPEFFFKALKVQK